MVIWTRRDAMLTRSIAFRNPNWESRLMQTSISIGTFQRVCLHRMSSNSKCKSFCFNLNESFDTMTVKMSLSFESVVGQYWSVVTPIMSVPLDIDYARLTVDCYGNRGGYRRQLRRDTALP